MRAIDCQGFAGGFTLGVVQAGWELVGKREMTPGFGVANCEMNRHLLGHGWETEAVEPIDWTVPSSGADLVFGNPPCSGFSVLSPKAFRGIDSKVNHCMWALVEYAAQVRPQIVIFESVSAAYTRGLDLMRSLRKRLQERTNESWTLYHVVHNAHALGGPALRRRYFWVASRVPFGVGYPELSFEPTLRDAIGDLETLGETWLPQPYRSPPTPWSASRRSVLGLVDGMVSDSSPRGRRIIDLADTITWSPGDGIAAAARRCYEETGRLPPSWGDRLDKLVETNFNFGFNAIARWNPDKPARVVTGAGTLAGLHYANQRTFTHREIARIMGFPDDWLVYPLRDRSIKNTWGKGITVDCGRWIAEWARRSLLGEPGDAPWEAVGDDEYEVTVTKPRLRAGGRIALTNGGSYDLDGGEPAAARATA